jgi:hypothetical protein
VKAIAALSILLATSCAAQTPRTEVMLEIVAGPGVVGASGQLIVDIYGGEVGTDPSLYELRRTLRLHEGPPPVEWPRRIALVPADSTATRGYRVVVEAQDDSGTFVARTEIVGNYDPGRTVLLPIELTDDCIGVSCDQTAPRCASGACTDPYVDAATLADLPVE